MGLHHAAHSSQVQFIITKSCPEHLTGVQVHFPSRLTRQYNLAMYTRCIHYYINQTVYRYIFQHFVPDQ